MIRQFSRSTVAAILLGTAVALPFAPAALAQPCADPRGNSFCQPNGLVTFNPPPGGSQPSSQPCADPRGNAYCTAGNLVGQNPTAGNLVGQNPTAGNLVGQNPTAGNLVGQNPTAGNLVGQNPTPGNAVVQNTPAVSTQSQTTPNNQAVVSSPAAVNATVAVDPPAASAGDVVTVTISGLPANASFLVNLGQLKTTAGQTYGAKSMPPADGASLQADADGNFSGTFTVPTVPDFIAPDGSVCAVILGRASYCAPISLQSVGLGTDGQASVDPAAGAVDGSGTTYCYSCQVLTNDNARRYGVYNSGSGNYEYHGARP